MGVQEISDVLKKHRREWLTSKQISSLMGLEHYGLGYSLRVLVLYRKEVIRKSVPYSQGRWVYKLK